MDEKKAFDNMLAEIGDDDSSDDGMANNRWKTESKRPQSGRKAVSKAADNYIGKNESGNMSSADAKYSSYNNYSNTSNSSSSSNQYKRPASSQTPKYQLSKEEQEIENFGNVPKNAVSGTASGPEPFTLSGEQVTISKRWLLRPVSRSDKLSMKCYIERERQGFALPTIYRCYLETPTDLTTATHSADRERGPQIPARFMMSAKKRASKKNNSYYLISLDLNPSDDKGSESVLGKVRSNNVGSRYLITDNGLAPDKTAAPSMLRKEMGVVSFEFDSGGPSRIETWVPFVSPAGVVSTWQPESEDKGIEAAVEAVLASSSVAASSISDTFNSPNGGNRLFFLQNKAPKWDEAHGGHVLNFQGRVTESSVKNFQLVCLNSDICDPEDITLQFGRVGKHRFTMDLKYPLSPLQAFGICIACLDGKIADRKGYEYIKKIAGSVTNVNSGSAQEFYGNKAVDGSHVDSEAQVQSRGSVTGSSSIGGIIREALPSSQYLRDKINRTFK